MKKKKEKKIMPLPRHKAVAKRILDNLGKKKRISISKIMEEEGYSKAYSKNPQQLTNTRSWEKILKEDFNDEYIAKKHKSILDKKELVVIDKEIVYTGQPHSDTKQALDMLYKIKSRYAPEEFNLKFKGFSREQLQNLILGKIAKKK